MLCSSFESSMFRRTCTLGLLLLVTVYALKLIIVGFQNLDLSEFKPVAAVFLLDVSASNRNLLAEQEQTILRISKRLDSEDQALVYVVTEDTYSVYNGNPHKLVAMKEAIRKRGAFDEKSFGTAYGLALKKAIGDALRYKQDGYKPAIIILGDLENDLDEVMHDRLIDLLGETLPVDYLQDSKHYHMVELIEKLTDVDCRKIYDHYNFACLKEIAK